MLAPEIVDPFSILKIAPSLEEVPIAREALRDRASIDAWPSGDIAAYLFTRDKGRDAREDISRDLNRWLSHLREYGIGIAQVPVPSTAPDDVFDQLSEHDGRIYVSVRIDPHSGMTGVRRLRQLTRAHSNIRSVSLSPHMTYPLIAPNSREYFPIYTVCVEEELAAFVNVGFPGPRVPAWAQDPIHLDEVCWYFPDLTVVMRHGGEPWVGTCAKMLLRWPHLYYATTAFAPRYYPQEIINMLNTRTPEKVIWAGYWPTIGYERIFAEIRELEIRAHRLEGFLSSNARRAFRLPVGSSSSALDITASGDKKS